MKKNYEGMEAYKVEFNATEQVAAAGCTVFPTSSNNYAPSLDASSCTILDTGYGDISGGGDPKYCMAGATTCDPDLAASTYQA